MRAEPLSVHAIDLVTGYQSFRGRKIVTHASFVLRANHVIGLIGPNGCGKTTLLRTLAGIMKPLSGTISIAGLSPGEYRLESGVGYLPEAVELPSHWSASGLAALAAVAGGSDAKASRPAAFDIAGIDFDCRSPVETLSKGMRQRVSAALSLLSLPDLILLDEPEAGLDPAQRLRFRDHIRSYARAGRIAVVASHDIAGVSTIADQVFLMTNQQLQLLHPDELRTSTRVAELFARGVA